MRVISCQTCMLPHARLASSLWPSILQGHPSGLRKVDAADGSCGLWVGVELHASLPCGLVSPVSISGPGGVSKQTPDLPEAMPGSPWAGTFDIRGIMAIAMTGQKCLTLYSSSS